tara:strand:- start:113700 stop:114809 length:1110 start_codon:yes stop_codon:yes gene_type:complete
MVRWGIIGAGRVAHDFVCALRTLPEASVTSVSSRNGGRAEAFAQSHSIESFTNSYEALLAREDVDVCYVGTPNASHVDISIAAMAAGKAVVCEKPLGCDTADVDRLIQHWNLSDTFCMEAMWMRFMPLIRRAHQLIQQGEIGVPLHMQADFTIPTAFDPASRFFSKDLGGGCLLDRGVYGISLAHLLFGKPVAVQSDALIGTTGVDEQTVVHLRHDDPDAVLSTITCGLRTYGSNDVTIMGTEGVLRIGKPFICPEYIKLDRFAKPIDAALPNHQVSVKSRRRVPRIVQPLIVRAKLLKQIFRSSANCIFQPHACNGYEYEACEVNRCLREGLRESPLMPLSDSRAVSETIDAARQSFGSNTETVMCHN